MPVQDVLSCPQKVEEGVRPSGTGGTNACEPWESNSGSLQGQMLLTAEPSLQPPKPTFLCVHTCVYVCTTYVCFVVGYVYVHVCMVWDWGKMSVSSSISVHFIPLREFLLPPLCGFQTLNSDHQAYVVRWQMPLPMNYVASSQCHLSYLKTEYLWFF